MNKRSIVLKRTIGMTLAMWGAVSGTAVYAADAPGQMEEVIVTAQKREQNIQDVPIVVTAVSEQLIKDTGVSDIKNLTILTPGLTVTSTGSEASTTARIRGIGTVGDNPGLESSVGVVIDGVYRPRNGVGFGNLGEIERIEVLKGPQGTLFGKNNDAGVINVITKRPSKTFGAEAEVTGGNFNDREANVSVTGPIAGDALAGRLYVGYGKHDGFMDMFNGVGPNTENKANDRNFYTARGQLLFSITDDLTLLLIGDYSKRVESCCAAVQTKSGSFAAVLNAIAATPALGGAPGATGVSSLNPLQPFDRRAYANRPIVQRIRDYGGSAELNWNFGAAKLTSITAWRDWSIEGGNDVDYSGIDLIYNPTDGRAHNDFKQFSEELRLAGEIGPVNWLVGGFYSDESLSPVASVLGGKNFETYVSGVVSAAGGASPPDFAFVSKVTGNAPGTNYTLNSGYYDQYHQTAKSYAFFTNETFTLTKGLDLIIGARYTDEKKDLDAHYAMPDGGFGCAGIKANAGPTKIPTLTPTQQALLLGYGCSTVFNPSFANLSNSQSRDENNVSGTAKLSYRFNEMVMVYGSYARGYKAGGFNLDRVTSAPGGAAILDTSFGAETVDSYELGAKTTLADRKLHLNLSVFDQKYKDFQLNTFTGIVFVVTSLPEVESKGADLDLTWSTPLKGVSLQSGVTYANTTINDFGTAGAFFSASRLNNRISFAPLWSGSLSATFEVPIASYLTWRSNAGFKYVSDYNTGSNLDPNKLQRGFGIVNARTGLGSPDGLWTIEAWVMNAADKGYYQVAFDAPFQANALDAYLGDPRTFGLTARFKF